jgi:zeaxanthin epoxidase
VLRRDIFDRPPIFTWARGRVALLGDSAHAMQPNLGQGGCMAIEDAHILALCLKRATKSAIENSSSSSSVSHAEGMIGGDGESASAGAGAAAAAAGATPTSTVPARSDVDVIGALQSYQSERLMRVSAIHGMAGMAAFMASTYRTYLGQVRTLFCVRSLPLCSPLHSLISF